MEYLLVSIVVLLTGATGLTLGISYSLLSGRKPRH